MHKAHIGENAMELQELQRNDPSLPKIITALRDFARLGYHANEVSPLTLAMLDATAAQLLMTLLTFCDETQGAFLLTTQLPDDWQEHALSLSLTNRHLFPVVACHHMSETMVLARLQQFSPEGSDIQWLVSETGLRDTLLWKRSFTIMPPYEETSPISAQPPSYAFFLFHCQTQNMHSTLEQWEHVLSLVTDAVDAVLVNVLLTLRLQGLERQTLRREQEQMELLRAELLATVSHELRSPLASIKGYTATLLRHDQQIDQKERYEFLQAIKEGSTRLEHIVDRLLELSQIETQRVSFAPVPLSLPSLVQEAITAAGQFQGGKSMHQSIIFLQNNVPLEQANERLVVSGDRRLLRALLDHLFENARLYSSPTSLIEVGVLEGQWLRPASDELLSDQAQRAILLYPPTQEKGQRLIELWIKDHGIGIAPEHLQAIFERFYRVDTRLTREVNGLGVGLAICKGIVELHAGGLWVESTIGVGSTFHVLLPQAALI